MSDAQLMERPRRWDAPFDPQMSDNVVDELLARPEFSSIEAGKFPAAAPLRGILQNDCRVASYKPGDIIVREGDYGNSAFLILSGTARVVLPPGLPRTALGRTVDKKRNAFSVLRSMLTHSKIPEVRDTTQYRSASARLRVAGDAHDSLLAAPDLTTLFGPNAELGGKTLLPPLAPEFKTEPLGAGALFGEVAALGRVQRSATIYAETVCRVVEMRWQALRDIKNRDNAWRERIEEGYRDNQLRTHLAEHPLLAGMDAKVLQEVADRTLFETYGSFEWNVGFKSGKRDERLTPGAEPLVAQEGDYPDGLLLVIGGFGRVSIGLGHGARTLTYLREGDYFGLDELTDAWKSGDDCAYESTLTALGYLHVLRIPYSVLTQVVFPRLEPRQNRLTDAALRPIADDSFLEWAVEQRFINGTQTMLIDLEKCTRCDDCVRACADTHGGNPKFIRHGQTLGNWMVANACMQCVDPVCMIGCPTGAIHRTVEGGVVVINDLTCIGCGTCANACPYDNIRLVPIREKSGQQVLDPASREPILKATKCDLCFSLPSGPSCERACPHDALKRVDIQSLVARAVQAI
jgi:Fe-S-cluster-containing dehydrogenase component/CRP-like cAMP-binding protein